MIVPLVDAVDPARFGGKAAALSTALRAGLPVPDGIALDVADASAVAAGDVDALGALAGALAGTTGRLAVRSSAVDEDGAVASFAGQHATRLGVEPDGVPAAVVEVVRSGGTASARAYRARLGLAPPPGVAVVVQRLVEADVAAVVFTRCPTTGRDVTLVEAAWGLGEAVVAGLVVPDGWELDADGRVHAERPGSRDVRVVARGGRTVEEPLPPELAGRPCLDAAALAGLAALVRRVEGVWPGPHDLEVAWAGGVLHLLQRRPVTR